MKKGCRSKKIEDPWSREEVECMEIRNRSPANMGLEINTFWETSKCFPLPWMCIVRVILYSLQHVLSMTSIHCNARLRESYILWLIPGSCWICRQTLKTCSSGVSTVCIKKTAVHLVASYDIFIIYSTSSEWSAQGQVFYWKLKHQGYSSAQRQIFQRKLRKKICSFTIVNFPVFRRVALMLARESGERLKPFWSIRQ